MQRVRLIGSSPLLTQNEYIMIEERRRKAAQERRLARELKIEQSTRTWEKEILSDWRVVHRNPALRKLWWSGIPVKFRLTLWEKATGNSLALSKGASPFLSSSPLPPSLCIHSGNYGNCLSRARRALSSAVFPSETLRAIEDDISTTLPTLHIFHPNAGPLYQDLKDMLCAWVISRADEGLGYTQGIAKIAAMILLNIPTPQAFIIMRNLLERHCLRAFYGGTGSTEDVSALVEKGSQSD